MTQHSIDTSLELNELAEGSPSSYEITEPASPLKTALLPIIDSTSDSDDIDAETNAQVNVKAEGEDDEDAQDASLTTDEAKKIPVSEKAKDDTKVPKVLIVEDTTELAEVIQATLERMNMVTYHETHGNKAMKRLKDVSPDVVLLDISLPDMTGWKILDVIKEARANGSNGKQYPVVIIITAYGDPANRLVGKLQGVHSYLIKPFTSDEIENIVTEALKSTTN